LTVSLHCVSDTTQFHIFGFFQFAFITLYANVFSLIAAELIYNDNTL